MPRPSTPRVSSSWSRSPSPQPTSSTFEPGLTILATSTWSARKSPGCPVARPPSGSASCTDMTSRPLSFLGGEPARLACRLQERTADVEELGHVEEERVVTAIGLDLGERYPRARRIQRVHQCAR